MGIGVVLMGTSLDNGLRQDGWSTLASCRPHFLFLSRPVDGQLRTPPQLLRLFDNFRLAQAGFYFSSFSARLFALPSRQLLSNDTALQPLTTRTGGGV